MDPSMILIATADDGLANHLARVLSGSGMARARSAKELWLKVRNETFDLVIIDRGLAPNAGTVLRRRLVVSDHPPDVLELTEAGSLRTVESLPVDTDDDGIVAEVFAKIHQRQALGRTKLIGRSAALFRIAELILHAAPSTVTILIEGESGTGKELVARAIHANSRRSDGPLVPVNCAALAEGVLESELFGHEKGAFTGAVARRKGVFELARGGTIFLDEIGELAPAIQVKLLRVLEEKEFMRVGGSESVRTDARIVAATNMNLARRVEEGKFRQDLFFRLCVVRIEIPPLRERPEDIEPLFWHFLRQIIEEQGRELPRVSRSAIQKLETYSWPGNARQLRNFAESIAVMKASGEINVEDVEDYIINHGYLNSRLPVLDRRREESVGLDLVWSALMALRHEVAALRRDLGLGGLAVPLREIRVDQEAGFEGTIPGTRLVRPLPNMEEMEREMIESALREARGNRRRAAEQLGIGERTLYRKIQKYELQEIR